MSDKIKIAVLQTAVHAEKMKNMEQLAKILDRPALEGVDLVTLPEMFNCPYDTKLFPEYAEEEGDTCWKICSELAGKHKIYLAAGSVPEKDKNGKIYNTSYVFDRSGRQIAKYRKMHLFDIAVEGGQYFKESDTLAAGDEPAVFDTEFGKIGLAICYDIRFPELFRILTDRGAGIVLVPASFNMTTGPAHWELLFRQRAVDNQVFMIGTSAARDESSGYVSWGHSIVTDPWGTVKVQMEDKENVYIGDLEMETVARIREQLPLLAHRRQDVYRIHCGE